MEKQRWQSWRFLMVLIYMLGMGTVWAAELPDSGQLIGAGNEKRLISPEKKTLQIVVPTEESGKESGTAAVFVRSIRIQGDSLFAGEKLRFLWRDHLNKQLSLAELEQIADQVRSYVQSRGYFLATTVIPEQNIVNGEVEIDLFVGHYGKIFIKNEAKLDSKVLKTLLAPLQPGELIDKDTLDGVLSRLNDRAGISIRATLSPGEFTGESDLLVELLPGRSVNGQIYSDNYGNRYAGANRSGVTVSFSNLTGRGDQLLLGGVMTSGALLRDGSFRYTWPMLGNDINWTIAYSSLGYRLGDPFAELQASGRITEKGIYEEIPLERLRNRSLTAKIGYEVKTSIDEKRGLAYRADKKVQQAVFALYGDSSDDLGNGGVNYFSLAYYRGKLSLQSEDSRLDDQLSQTAGKYDKWLINGYRRQSLGNRLDLSLEVTGQLAGKNLDSAEKFYLGGPHGVRAYPQGEGGGDEGWLWRSEIAWKMPDDQFQVLAFFDRGQVKINKNAVGSGPNGRLLLGAGVGLLWQQPGKYGVRLDYAWKVGREAALSATDSPSRLWLQGVMYF
ncbi:MAG: ShlB/FhaC/HecB family hemolysin secretion/activation protein [Sporomusaceae bacterium]|nr:ShlB/FhaC/HecB family hemolysin secretion/activation protein [Sporomusaceae bacterium]